MLRSFCALLLLSSLLLAADFWAAKPPLEWSDKDVQKMITNSPWAHQSNYETGGPAGRGGGGGGTGMPDLGGGAEDSAPAAGGGGGRGGRGGGGPQGGSAEPVFAQAPVILRWQTALPIKQAMLKRQLGSEMNTSEEAKKILERQEQFYVMFVATTAPAARGLAQRKDALMQASSLNIKGKDAIHPQEIQFGNAQGASEMYLLFPRTTPITVEDKEVEFATKIGNMSIKYKFRLKDMVYNGKLEL